MAWQRMSRTTACAFARSLADKHSGTLSESHTPYFYKAVITCSSCKFTIHYKSAGWGRVDVFK